MSEPRKVYMIETEGIGEVFRLVLGIVVLLPDGTEAVVRESRNRTWPFPWDVVRREDGEWHGSPEEAMRPHAVRLAAEHKALLVGLAVALNPSPAIVLERTDG